MEVSIPQRCDLNFTKIPFYPNLCRFNPATVRFELEEEEAKKMN